MALEFPIELEFKNVDFFFLISSWEKHIAFSCAPRLVKLHAGLIIVNFEVSYSSDD